jgi:hypothetical protein
MHYSDLKDSLIVFGEDMILSHYVHTNDGRLVLEPSSIKIKLGTVEAGKVVYSEWIDNNRLVFLENGKCPRIWDSFNEETTVLEKPGTESFTYKSFCFSRKTNILACSTDSGHIVLWLRHISMDLLCWEVYEHDIANSPNRINRYSL